MKTTVVETDLLIVGAGPAGGALAAFLAQNGLKGIVISNAPGTADTPRAHLVNPFALECLRDIQLEDEALRLGIRGRSIQALRWCQSMCGIEYGRIHAWGAHPDTMRDTVLASPCEWIDLPQSYMEPILVKYATHHGFQLRFSTELVGVERAANGGPVLCTLRDLMTGSAFQVRARYLFGADGGRSKVARELDFGFAKSPPKGVAANVLLHADLDHLMATGVRQAQLHTVVRADSKSRFARFGLAPIMRMIRPWTQWMLVCMAAGAAVENPFEGFDPRSPELVGFVREIIGDESVHIDVERVDPWVIREVVAERFSSAENDAFLLGDAAHRHPPSLGLGSNTSIQDAYNLAWKVAYVERGLAGRGLLETYTRERQPVGAELVRESNIEILKHMEVCGALGLLAETEEEGRQLMGEFPAPTTAGAERRERLHKALEKKRAEGESIGIAMNQWYDHAGAVYVDDEPEPRPPLVEGGAADDSFLVKIQISTYPGTRLPHAWLDMPTRRKEISTADLAGHGAFCLLTGVGGEAWKRAAQAVTAATGIPINCYGIGFGLDYHDVYRDWWRNRGVDEDGCVLVRPDRFVAWRSTKMIPDCEGKLLSVLNRILWRDQIESSTTRQ